MNVDKFFKNISLLSLLFISALLFISILTYILKSENNNNEGLLNVFKYNEEPIVKIYISDSLWMHEKWNAVIVDKNLLYNFQNELSNADVIGVSGHSGPVGEWLIEIEYQSGVIIPLLGSVHRHDGNDLFISDGYYSYISGRKRFLPSSRKIRIRGWADWIINTVPEGKLEN